MKKEGKAAQKNLWDTRFEDDTVVQVRDKLERKKIKEAVKKISAAAGRRIQELQAELDSVREQLEREIEKRNQAEESLRKREPLLTERVKEISCLYSIVSIMADRSYTNEEEKLRDIVKLVPPGWLNPEDAYAQIVLWGKEFKTENFQDTPWKQIAPVYVNSEPQGILAVGYLQEKPVREEGPFLLEERTLINVLAKLLGEIIGPKVKQSLK
jgi:hypothetical protein